VLAVSGHDLLAAGGVDEMGERERQPEMGGIGGRLVGRAEQPHLRQCVAARLRMDRPEGVITAFNFVRKEVL